MRGGAEPPLLLEGVDLDDGAVGVVAERVAVGLQPPAVVDHRVERRAGLRPRIRLEAGLAERRDRVRVRAESELAPLAYVIQEDVERPARRDGGVLLAHGAGRGVAGIRERPLAGLLQGAVQLLEVRARHEDFAAHLELGHVGERAAQEHGQRADGLEVRRDVLAHAAVAAGGAAHEAPALVEERDAEAVDLRLAHVREARARQRAVKPRLELAQVVGRRGVVEREHGRAVLDRAEGIHGLAGHALRGTVRGDEVGKGGLHLAQLPHERVVLRVGDLGPRLGVIEVVVMVDLLPQLADALESVSPRHGASA